MLAQALEKLLEALGLSAGMIMLADPKKGLSCVAKQGVPAELPAAFAGRRLEGLTTEPVNLKGIVIGGEVIRHTAVMTLAFHHRRLGALVLFVKEGEETLDQKVVPVLEALADELAAAIFYSRLMGRLRTA
jgi:hypothetical protein